MPYKTALIYTYDCGYFPKNLEDALVKADYKGFSARAKESNTTASCAASACRPRWKHPTSG